MAPHRATATSKVGLFSRNVTSVIAGRVASASLRFCMLRNFVVLVVACLAVACAPSEHTLSVDVVTTGIVAGADFHVVSVTVLPAGASRTNRLDPLALHEEYVAFSDDVALRRGRRVADFPGTRDGAYSLRVRLLSPMRSAIVLERWSSIVVRGSTRISIDLDGRCIRTVCPAPSGSESFTECSQGRCVDPVCNLEDPSTWVEHCCDPNDPRVNCAIATYCTSSSDCESRNTTCSDSSCERALCVDTPRPGACEPEFYCAYTEGCLPLTAIPDAGVPDAAHALDASVDAPLSILDAPLFAADVDAADARSLDAPESPSDTGGITIELDSDMPDSAMLDAPPPSVDAPMMMMFPDSPLADGGDGLGDTSFGMGGADTNSDSGSGIPCCLN